MIDASKFPKAARLQQQREEKYAAEQARMKTAAEIRDRLPADRKAKIAARTKKLSSKLRTPTKGA